MSFQDRAQHSISQIDKEVRSSDAPVPVAGQSSGPGMEIYVDSKLMKVAALQVSRSQQF